ncbi:MAG TPA: fimbria/pilus periplasmic chaperone [Gammaproteobacteria bacterium]
MRCRWLLVGTLLLSGAAHAGALKVWPVKVAVSPELKSESVRLTNDGDAAINVQISAKAWDMDEMGQFIEVDTGDFVFFPRLLTIPPHEEKAVRVGYQGDFPATEKPYRLLIEELPPVRTPEQQAQAGSALGMTYILRLSLPLFVMPDKVPPPAQVAIDGVENTPVGMRLGIKALGNYHIEVKKVVAQLLDGAGTPLAEGELTTPLLRILPQRRVFVDVPLKDKPCQKAKSLLVKVHAERLKEPYEQNIPLAGGSCQAVNH